MKFQYQRIKTENGQTGYITLGSGSPMILLVGYSGNLLHWNSQLVYALAEHFTLYLPDNREVGETNSTNPYSMEGLALDVADFISALKLVKPIIVGWSMGGIIAQALANLAIVSLGGMALIASQPDYSFTSGNLHILVENLRLKPGRENRDKLMELFFSQMPSIELRKYLAKAVLPIDGYVYPYNEVAQKLQDQAITNWKMAEAKLQQCSCPVLICCAKNDLVTDYRASIVLHELLPYSKLISYSEGGHFFLHHFPLQLAEEILSFFSKIISPDLTENSTQIIKNNR